MYLPRAYPLQQQASAANSSRVEIDWWFVPVECPHIYGWKGDNELSVFSSPVRHSFDRVLHSNGGHGEPRLHVVAGNVN